MKLADALRLLNTSSVAGGSARHVGLACGFTPLHLQTFLAAAIAQRTGAAPEIKTGLFGDLLGTVRDLDTDSVDAVAVVVEWSDLDERLGYRTSHGWRMEALADIVTTVRTRLAMLGESIDRIGTDVAVAIALPTLPLPQVFPARAATAAPEVLEMHRAVADWAAARGITPGTTRVLDPGLIDLRSPPEARLRLNPLLASGFPYSLGHASALGDSLAECLFPSPPLKGVITDLDDTLWRGVLGEDGIEGVSWNLEQGSHGHALYQEMLAALAERGILVAVVSKNDPALVEQALAARTDLVLSPERVFPIEAGWGEKSAAVARVLDAWNVGPDAVLFIDDVALEREEVARAFPTLRCLEYPTTDDDRLPDLLATLATAFAKSTISEEDRLRLDSLRSAHEVAPALITSPDELLADIDAQITFELDVCDQRTVDLINKTNQFNLNGRRVDESVTAKGNAPGEFLVGVSYRDKFGPLGKIAVMHGRADDAEVEIDLWVMSCRAFSRRIEHHTLRWLFEHTGATAARLDYVPTERNGVLRDFLEPLAEPTEDGVMRVNRGTFTDLCPPLYASVVSDG